MDNRIEQVKNGELVIENDDRDSLIKCISILYPGMELSGNFTYYRCMKYDVSYFDGKTLKPTLKATELLKLLSEPEPQFKPKFGDRVLAWNEKNPDNAYYYVAPYWNGHLVVSTSQAIIDIKSRQCTHIYPFKHIAPIPEQVTMSQVAKALGKELGTFKIIDDAS